MARQPRIEYPGAYYHVMSRGDRRERIFEDDEDRKGFLRVLEETCVRCGWQVVSWVLMGNHFHLQIHTPEPNLVTGMKRVQRGQSWFLDILKRKGSVVKGDTACRNRNLSR